MYGTVVMRAGPGQNIHQAALETVSLKAAVMASANMNLEKAEVQLLFNELYITVQYNSNVQSVIDDYYEQCNRQIRSN